MTETVEEKWSYSKWKGGGITLSLFGNVCCMLGFMSTSWAVTANRSYNPNYEGLGLWRFCAEDASLATGRDDACHDTSKLSLPDWFVATQGTVTTGFIFLFASLVVLTVSECFKACRSRNSLLYIFLPLAFTSVVLLTTGVAMFGVEIGNLEVTLTKSDQPISVSSTQEPVLFELSWSYILVATSAGLEFCAMIVAGCHLVCARIFTESEPEVEMQNPSQSPTSGPTDVRYEHF